MPAEISGQAKLRSSNGFLYSFSTNGARATLFLTFKSIALAPFVENNAKNRIKERSFACPEASAGMNIILQLCKCDNLRCALFSLPRKKIRIFCKGTSIATSF
jgi:hypothetical protein